MTRNETIGSYQLIEPIGRGGMGEVWRGRHRYLKRDAAVKFIRPEALAPERSAASRGATLKRFEREARATSSLRSPHTIQIFDFGATPDGGFYYAMELLDAVNLEDLVRRYGPLPQERVLHLAQQVCESLGEAHAMGLIHRDIKPGNLLLCRLGPLHDFMKVLDFGLVRHRTRPAGDPAITQDLAPVGTPAYMSPEAITGRGDPDARSDIYALGCVLYWLLTGSTVFAAGTPAEVMAAHVRDRPDPPSEKSEIPLSPELEEIVLSCLSKDPGDRPETAGALSKRLSRCPVDSAWTPEMAERWWRLHEPETLVSSIPPRSDLDSALGPTLSEPLPPVSPTPPARSIVVLPLANLSSDPGQEPFVLGMHDAIVGELARIGALTVISRTSALAYKDTTKPVPEIARELNVDAVLEGTVLRAGDDVRISLRLVAAPSERLLWSETYDRPVRDILPVHTEVARAVAQRIRVSLTSDEAARLVGAASVDPEVYDLYVRGRQVSYSFEESDLYRAIEHFREAVAKDPRYAPAYAGIGRCYNELTTYGFLAPSEGLPRSASAVRKALELDDSLGEGHASLAYSMVFFDWDFETSRAEFERALELEPNNVSCLALFGRYLSLVGEFDLAHDVLTRACTVDPLSPMPPFWRAWAAFMARDYEQAVEELEDILQTHPGFPYALLWMGACLVQIGEQKRAIKLAGAVEEAVGLSNDHNLLAVLGWTWGRAGHHDKARRILKHFHTVSKRRWVDPGFIATVHSGMNEREETFASLERAFKVRSLLMAYLPYHPFLDGWRDDPRYLEVIRAMKGVTVEGR